MQELRIGPNEAGQRMDKYLKKALPGAPMGLLFKQLRNKNITLNRKKAQGNEILSLGDTIECFFSQETFAQFQGNPVQENKKSEYESAYLSLGSEKKIPVLYEDEHVLILNKPAGVLSQKAFSEDASLNEWMIGRLLENGSLKKHDLKTFTPSIVNRIDRNTTGIVLGGKSLPGLQALSRLLHDRKMEKYYLTICHGILKESREVRAYLRKDEKTNQVQIFDTPRENAQEIRTRYRSLQTAQDHTLLEIELITGKPHQIRAHLSSLGHPILGDTKYGDSRLTTEDKKLYHLSHQLLHAQRVCFPLWETVADEYAAYETVLKPLSGKEILAPLPDQFQKIKDSLFE